MELWNDGTLGFLKDIIRFQFYRQDDNTINPTLQYPKSHFSNIPSFQHSNWGEAPNLDLPSLKSFFMTMRISQIGQLGISACGI